MELWLLGVGAVVLIAITIWIVWPARAEDKAMNPDDTTARNLPPQGDRFEDQYTSATGDLSAGGVATGIQQPQPSAGDAPTTMQQPDLVQPGLAREGTGDRYQTPIATSHGYPGATDAGVMALADRRNIGIGGGALLVVGGAVGGVWLYNRWQERNKPVNRFRRRARDVAGRISDRLPDIDELPTPIAPTGGAAVLMLSSLALARALRSSSSESGRVERARSYAERVPWRDLVESVDWRSLVEAAQAQSQRMPSQKDLRKLRESDLGKVSQSDLRRLAKRAPHDLQSTDRAKPAFMGLGIGGLAAVAGGSYLVWRVLRG